MRRHLLDELDASRRATEALTLGEPAVVALQEALTHRPFRRTGLEVAGQIESALGVLAGDFLDIVELDDHRVGVILGDVSGHGPVAALVGLRLKIAIGSMLGRVPLEELLPRVRGGLADQPEMFATVFVAIVDLAADTLSYVNAGHPPPLFVRAGKSGEGPDDLDPTGPLLSAVLADATWETDIRSFGPGDSLLAFSDGVLEARDGVGEEFGADGVLGAVADISATHGHRGRRSAARPGARPRPAATRRRDDPRRPA